jgi:hypothetical protein
MSRKEKVVPAPPSEKRREQFRPHESPKRQPDGDPGPNSIREDLKGRSPEAEEREGHHDSEE